MTSAGPDTHSPPDQGARSDPLDWPQMLPIRVWLVQQAERWIAFAEEFDIAGQGASEKAAIRDMGELLADYLNACMDEGMALADAVRPIPLREKLRLRALHLVAAPLPRRHAQCGAAYRRTFNLNVHGGHVGRPVG